MSEVQLIQGVNAISQGGKVVKVVANIGQGVNALRVAGIGVEALKSFNVAAKINNAQFASLVESKIGDKCDSPKTVADALNIVFADKKTGLTASVVDGKIEIKKADETASSSADKQAVDLFGGSDDVAKTNDQMTPEQIEAKAKELENKGIEVPAGLTAEQINAKEPTAEAQKFVADVMTEGGIKDIGDAKKVAA